jgi:hypothetical protein
MRSSAAIDSGVRQVGAEDKEQHEGHGAVAAIERGLKISRISDSVARPILTRLTRVKRAMA